MRDTIGIVSFDKTSWFSGFDEKYFYGKGAFYKAFQKHSALFWMICSALRTYGNGEIPFIKTYVDVQRQRIL